MVPVKNFSLLITVFAKIHQNYQHTRLIIIGSGPEEQSLRALIKQYSIEPCVDIIIGVRAEDYYDQFDIFVQPSFSEGLSRALLEAMSYSLPVIVSAHKKNHDVITHNKTGILIDPHNPEDLFNALIKLIGDQELRIRLQHAGRHHIKKHYTLSTMISHYRHIITALS
ncbi:MAG: glycosyltransferase [Candidatus Dependentiae bacterium]|nr:glycosyltransferase [Candidatus Dependentiae bacterium]